AGGKEGDDAFQKYDQIRHGKNSCVGKISLAIGYHGGAAASVTLSPRAAPSPYPTTDGRTWQREFCAPPGRRKQIPPRLQKNARPARLIDREVFQPKQGAFP